MMTRIAVLLLLALTLRAEDEAAPKVDAVPQVDIGAVLRKSKAFAEKCKKFRISFADGEVRAEGEIGYRGGGPCEFLVSIYPAKSHETIVLLDNGPWEGEGRRPRTGLEGYAPVLNNAFLAAGFKRGKPFSWDDETGETFDPEGETVHIYVEWKEDGKLRRALMSDWLWNFRTVHVMEPKFVYTGSLLIEHDGKKYLGAELDGLIVAVLSSATALMDHTEDGAMDNGAYEAIGRRIPKSGTRVQVVFSKKKLKDVIKFEPLKLNDELKKSRAAYLAKKKAEAEAAAKKKKQAEAEKK